MIPALRDLDTAVHKNRDEAKLTSALKAAVAKHARHFDPVVSHLCKYVLHATTSENAFERVQRAQAMATHAITQAIDTAQLKIGRHTIVTLGEDSLLHDALNASKAKVHAIGEGDALRRAATVYDPLAMRQALKHADMAIIPGVLVTPSKVIAPMGAELLADLCSQQGVPCYALTLGLRYVHHDDHLPKLRGAKTEHGKRGKHTVHAAAFEQVHPDKITILSELGVFSHARFIDEVQHHYPWI